MQQVGRVKKLKRITDQMNANKETEYKQIKNKMDKTALTDVVKSLPQDNYCNVCNLPTDGKKCYSKRCPV